MNTYSKPLNCPNDVLQPLPLSKIFHLHLVILSFFISFILEKFSDFFFLVFHDFGSFGTSGQQNVNVPRFEFVWLFPHD